MSKSSVPEEQYIIKGLKGRLKLRAGFSGLLRYFKTAKRYYWNDVARTSLKVR